MLFSEIARSARQFAQGIISQYRWWAPSFLPELLEKYQKWLAPSLPPRWDLGFTVPWQLSLAVFIIGIVVSALVTYHKLRMDRLTLEERLRPKLQIMYGAGDPFEQKTQWPDGIEWLFRVGVRNISSGATVNDVAVRVVSMAPTRLRGLPLPLHLMNNNPANDGDWKRSFSVNPGAAPEYADVVLIPPQGNVARVWHVVQGIENNLAPGTHELTLEASGRDCPTESARFQLTFNEEGERTFVRLD